MKQKTFDPQRKPADLPPPPAGDARTSKEQAETKEVAGRHGNDGQKDHKGAR